jgi:CheY-like chemotaxis protein
MEPAVSPPARSSCGNLVYIVDACDRTRLNVAKAHMKALGTGYQVMTSASAVEQLQKGSRPDVIFLDSKMKQPARIALVSNLRMVDSLREIPIVMGLPVSG